VRRSSSEMLLTFHPRVGPMARFRAAYSVLSLALG